jgi:hypothetical protein
MVGTAIPDLTTADKGIKQLNATAAVSFYVNMGGNQTFTASTGTG